MTTSRRLRPLLAMLAFTGCADAELEPVASENQPILGGSLEPDHLFPWVVENAGCHGTLIAPSWVLTAAHCPHAYSVVHRRRDPVTGQIKVQERTVAKMVRHPDHQNYNGAPHDIALIKLAQPMQLDGLAAPAALPRQPRTTGEVGTIASMSHSVPNPDGILSVMRVPILAWSDPLMFETQSPAMAACEGDSGSGFVTFARGFPTVTGVLSYRSGGGGPCAVGQRVGMSDVAADIDWIIGEMERPELPGAGGNTSAHANTCRSAPPRPSTSEHFDLAATRKVGDRFVIMGHESSTTSFAEGRTWATFYGPQRQPDQLAGDFNGDGATDLATVVKKDGRLVIWVREANDGRLQMWPWRDEPSSTDHPNAIWLPGDFDGDGRDDLAEIWKESGKVSIAVLHSTGFGFNYRKPWATKDATWADNTRWVVGYFTEDDQADLLAVVKEGNENAFYLRRSTGTALAAPADWGKHMGGWASNTQWLGGDYNGDGTTDLAGIWRNGNNTWVAVYPSDGSRMIGWTQWDPGTGGWGDDIKWTSGDYTGDGRADLAAVWNNGGNNVLTVRASTGSSFSHVHWLESVRPFAHSTEWCSGVFH